VYIPFRSETPATKSFPLVAFCFHSVSFNVTFAVITAYKIETDESFKSPSPLSSKEIEFSGMRLTTGTTSSINHYQDEMTMLDCKISVLPQCICDLGSSGFLRSVGGIVTDVTGTVHLQGSPGTRTTSTYRKKKPVNRSEDLLWN